MIGADTNVLLRAFAAEEGPQTARARAVLAQLEAKGEKVWVNSIVLCEFVWVLRSSKRLSRAQIGDLIELLLATTLLRFADQGLVEDALRLFRSTRLDFADALIGVLNRRAGCTTTYTFDRRAAETPDFSPVG
jgi:predicted nucleic-acid-binding protein